MLPRTYSEQKCSIARSLEAVGERWTLLILRDAFLGVRCFDDFQARLEMSRNVLTRRLTDLVEAGLLRREPYQERPTRYHYLPTEKALEFWPALIAFHNWGTEHAAPEGAPREFAHADCGTELEVEVRCPHCDVAVTPQEAVTRPGPAWRGSPGALPALTRERPLLTDVR